MTADPVPPSYGRRPVPPLYGRRRKSDAVTATSKSSGRRRKRKKSPEKKSGRRRRSDGGEATDRASGTEPIDLEGVTLSDKATAQMTAASGRRRRSAPINLKGVTLRTDSGAAAPINLKGVTLRSSKDDDDETRDDDDAKDSKQLVDPSTNKRYAAVADQAYEDNRLKEYPSLKDATFDPVLSDERNVVFHDKKDGSTWWGIRGTDFSSPKDLATDMAIVGEHVGEARFNTLTKLFSIPPSLEKALPFAKKMILSSRDERFANTEAKYQQIRKKYKKGIINIGAHSLGGAVAQHLLKSLSPKQEKEVRVHVFNGLPLHGFDSDKHLGSYHETHNRFDLISIHAKGKNVRVVEEPSIKFKDGESSITMKRGESFDPMHSMGQFVGMDLNNVPRGQPMSLYDTDQPPFRGDLNVRDRVISRQMKKTHKETRAKIRKALIKGLRPKPQTKLRRGRVPSVKSVKQLAPSVASTQRLEAMKKKISKTKPLERKRGKSPAIIKGEL